MTETKSCQQSWSEIYRPREFDQYVGQTSPVSYFQHLLRSGNAIQHLILYGPAGVGKTSLVYLYIDKYLSDVKRKSNYVLHVNASAIGNIEMVRTKLKPFCQLPLKRHVRLIILDEADKMTEVCQNALRRLIENYSSRNRFVFIVNQVSKLHMAIRSRCQMFQFLPLQFSTCVTRLQSILSQQGWEDVNLDHLETIVQHHNGDMRKCVSSLQDYNTCSQIYSDSLSDEDLMDIVLDRIPRVYMNKVVEAILHPDIDRTELIQEFQVESYSLQDLLHQLSPLIVCHADLSNVQKAKISIRLNSIWSEMCESHQAVESDIYYFQQLF